MSKPKPLADLPKVDLYFRGDEMVDLQVNGRPVDVLDDGWRVEQWRGMGAVVTLTFPADVTFHDKPKGRTDG